MDIAGLIHLRVNGAAFKARCIDIFQPADLHITESKESKPGTDLAMFAIGHISKFRLRVPVVVVIKVSVLQDLTELQGHGRTRRNQLGTNHVARKILSKIQHRFAGWCMDHFPDREAFHIFYGRRIPGDQLTGSLNESNGLPLPQRG